MPQLFRNERAACGQQQQQLVRARVDYVVRRCPLSPHIRDASLSLSDGSEPSRPPAGTTCFGCFPRATTWPSGAPARSHGTCFQDCAHHRCAFGSARRRLRDAFCGFTHHRSRSFRWRVPGWAALPKASCASAGFAAGGVPWHLLLFPRGNARPFHPPHFPSCEDTHVSLYLRWRADVTHIAAADALYGRGDDIRLALIVHNSRADVPPIVKTTAHRFRRGHCARAAQNPPPPFHC